MPRSDPFRSQRPGGLLAPCLHLRQFARACRREGIPAESSQGARDNARSGAGGRARILRAWSRLSRAGRNRKGASSLRKVPISPSRQRCRVCCHGGVLSEESGQGKGGRVHPQGHRDTARVGQEHDDAGVFVLPDEQGQGSHTYL